VWLAPRHKEGVGHGAGTQDGSEHDSAQKAGYAREKRNSTNCQDAVDHANRAGVLRRRAD
jgi:hypothetical protein